MAPHPAWVTLILQGQAFARLLPGKDWNCSDCTANWKQKNWMGIKSLKLTFALPSETLYLRSLIKPSWQHIFSPRASLWMASSPPKCGDRPKVTHNVIEYPTSLRLKDFKGFSSHSPQKLGISMILEILFDLPNVCWFLRCRPFLSVLSHLRSTKTNPRA